MSKKQPRKQCYGMRRHPSGMGDIKCRRLAEHGKRGLCHGCYDRVSRGGDPYRTYLPWGRIKARKRLKEQERLSAQSLPELETEP